MKMSIIHIVVGVLPYSMSGIVPHRMWRFNPVSIFFTTFVTLQTIVAMSGLCFYCRQS